MRMTRNFFFGAALLLSGSIALSSCTKGGEVVQKDDKKLNIYTWTYYTPEDAVNIIVGKLKEKHVI